MIKSALEPLNCTVFGGFEMGQKIFSSTFHLQICIFIPRDFFPEVMSVVLFSRLYMTCAPFLSFRYIWIENGMIGSISLCRMLARFKDFFQARIDITKPEYCRKLIVTLYDAFSSSYV